MPRTIRVRLPRVTQDTFHSILSGTDQWVIQDQYGTARMTVRDGGCFVENLEIREECRGKGHGTRFLRALEQKAARMGSTILALQVGRGDTDRPDPKLRSWYIKQGYKAVRGTQGWIRYKSLNKSE